MHNIRTITVALSAVALLSTSAAAQRQQGAPRPQGIPSSTKEFGIDGGITFYQGEGNNDFRTIELPNGIFRVGFHRNQTWSIEPYTQISWESNDAFSQSRLLLGAGLLYHLSTSRLENQWYVRPFIALDHRGFNDKVPPENDVSTNQLQLGAGFGLKMPLADRIGARFELNLGRALESGNDVPGYTIIGLQAGLSYFTR